MKKQLYYAVWLGCVIAFCAGGIFNPQKSTAQIILSGTSYIQNFDSLEYGMPNGWSVDTGMKNTTLGYDVSATFFLNTTATNTRWNSTTGKFKNVASGIAYTYFADATNASQTAQSNRALGLRQNAALDKNVGFVLKIANTTGFNNFMLSFNLQSLDSNISRITTWMVDYGVGNDPDSFIAVTTTGNMTTGGNQFSKNMIAIDFGNALDNKNDTVCIRIVSLASTTGSGNRATSAIDDYNLSWSNIPPPTNMELIGKTPTDTSVSLSTSELTLHFDNLIQSGTGQIDLYKSGNSIPSSFTVPSAAVTIMDSTAIVNGISLENNTDYYVLINTGTFIKQGGTLPNEAITDTTYWTFSTIDTTPPPLPAPLMYLNESFVNCTDSAMGNFIQFNNQGTKIWRCITSGHNDAAAVAINAGIAAGASDINEDWLISKLPFDFSAMTNPVLGFWQKRRFEGTVTRTIKLSTNYISGTNPSNAAWTILQTQDISVAPAADVWSQVKDIALGDFKMVPFYLAFTYSCSDGGAYELSYDDIKVEERTVGIYTPSHEIFGLKVLGEATSDRITLGVYLKNKGELNIQIYDMAGRVAYRKNISGQTGYQQIVLNETNVHPGIYVIRVLNESNIATVKTVIK